MTTTDITVIGAGPYGLSAGAHLKRIKGLDLRVFGEPMEFWDRHMPAGMFLRSPWSASHLSDPDTALTLDGFREKTRSDVPVPIPLAKFVEYGRWFQRQAVPVDRRRIVRIAQEAGHFRVTLDDGETFLSRRVVVAGGIGPFARRPDAFRHCPPDLVVHSSDRSDIERYRGKRVVVIGAGQSALESAALIHEVGGHVEVIIRQPAIHWLGWRVRLQKIGPLGRVLYSPYDIGPAGVSRIVAVPDLVRYFPRGVQNRFRVRALRPAGATWLVDRCAKIQITAGRSVVSAAPTGGKLNLKLDDGSSRNVDEVVMGTGYKVDVSQYPFLPSELSRLVNCESGFPKLSRGFESSVPGLHFMGAPSAWTFGPLMYFVAGTEYAARTLARHLAGLSRNSAA
jgi:hypothetical protein